MPAVFENLYRNENPTRPLWGGGSAILPGQVPGTVGDKLRRMAGEVRYEDQCITILPLDDLILSLNNELKEYNADIVVLKGLADAGSSVVKQISLIGVMGMAYVKTASDGKQYVVFKGYAGARPNLPGTRYLRSHPKMAVFTLSNAEYLKNGLKALRVAFVIYAGIRILEELRQDQFSFARLFTGLASDLVQALIASLVGIAVAAVAGSIVTFFFGVAVPVVIVVALVAFSSLIAGIFLMRLDNDNKITENLINYSMKLEKNTLNELSDIGSRLCYFIDIIDSIHKSISNIRSYRYNFGRNYLNFYGVF
ncbi:hypothetical protein GE253_12990 [Niveispirillum sp. SYP-B3756]|uniref:hypothetical protein n=1 Tax=Niveispirillum sp. SYP-B3756 TaxID=2662178 RepID=UPI001291727B|nr:hypothetical protein [Niveispirillum sp. SYP-B3756]MQP66256.1 hypothetical protein [Niveispirillum sp. SYP-B3756]